MVWGPGIPIFSKFVRSAEADTTLIGVNQACLKQIEGVWDTYGFTEASPASPAKLNEYQ